MTKINNKTENKINKLIEGREIMHKWTKIKINDYVSSHHLCEPSPPSVC